MARGTEKKKAQPRHGGNSKELESRLREACTWLRKPENRSRTMVDAVQEFKLDGHYHTLRRRYLNQSLPATKGPVNQQILSEIQQEILVEWMKLWSAQSKPATRESLRVKVEKLTGKKPSIPGCMTSTSVSTTSLPYGSRPR